jgi:hypothetical protein
VESIAAPHSGTKHIQNFLQAAPSMIPQLESGSLRETTRLDCPKLGWAMAEASIL